MEDVSTSDTRGAKERAGTRIEIEWIVRAIKGGGSRMLGDRKKDREKSESDSCHLIT